MAKVEITYTDKDDNANAYILNADQVKDNVSNFTKDTGYRLISVKPLKCLVIAGLLLGTMAPSAFCRWVPNPDRGSAQSTLTGGTKGTGFVPPKSSPAPANTRGGSR